MNLLVMFLFFSVCTIWILREIFVKPVLQIIDKCESSLFVLYEYRTIRRISNPYIFNKFRAEQKLKRIQTAVDKIHDVESAVFTQKLMTLKERKRYTSFLERLPSEWRELEEAKVLHREYLRRIEEL